MKTSKVIIKVKLGLAIPLLHLTFISRTSTFNGVPICIVDPLQKINQYNFSLLVYSFVE